jgi:hypothetical protein
MMVNFLNFLCVFPLFISNTSIVSINFGANLDAQNAGNDISGIQKFCGLQPLLSPSNILSHRKLLFKKCLPHGKILKKGPVSYSRLDNCFMNY